MPLKQVISCAVDGFIASPTALLHGCSHFPVFYVEKNLFDLVLGYDLITLFCWLHKLWNLREKSQIWITGLITWLRQRVSALKVLLVPISHWAYLLPEVTVLRPDWPPPSPGRQRCPGALPIREKGSGELTDWWFTADFPWVPRPYSENAPGLGVMGRCHYKRILWYKNTFKNDFAFTWLLDFN